MNETVVTEKGTTTIPTAIRRALGIAPRTILEWSTHGQVIEAPKKPGIPRTHPAAGWVLGWRDSGKELLRRTRP